MKSLVSRKAITQIQAIVIILIIVVVAVAAYFLTRPAPEEPEPTPEEEEIEKILIAAYSEGGSSADPVLAFADLTSYTISLHIHESLVGWGKSTLPNGKVIVDSSNIVPLLAESWDVSPDGKTYTFYLRQDVKFSNGDPFTAEAVKYSYDRALTMGFSGGWLLGFGGMDLNSTKVIDDYTVEITLKGPSPFFLNCISSIGIVNPDFVEAHGGITSGQPNEYMTDHAMGTGPFTLESYDPATECVLVANENYWNGTPALDKVVLRFVPEVSTREMLIKNGDVDLAIEIPTKDIDSLKEDPNVVLEVNPSPRILYLSMLWKPPFDDVRIRKAVAYSVPYEEILENVMYGYATQLKSIVPDTAFGFDGSFFKYNHNLTKAKELLTEAGYPDGFDCELTLGSGFADWESDAVIVQSELAKIGINMDIRKVARAEFLTLTREGKAQMYISKLTPAINDVTYDAYMFFYVGGLAARDGYNNTRLNELVEQAITELEPQKRIVLNEEMQEIITDDVGWVYLYQYPNVLALRDDVKDFTYCNSEMVLYYFMDK